jgi:hypothetical protein
MRLLVGGLLLMLALPPLARGQDSVIVIDPDQPPGDSAVVRGGPAPGVVAELLAFYNDSGTTRMEGDVNFPPGSAFTGRLALYRGTLRIAGSVRGDLVVVNATLYLLPGADIEGGVLVVGGRLIRSPEARHLGRERVIWDAAPVLRSAAGVLVVRERRRPLSDLAAARTSFQTGKVRTTLLLATGGTYDRIEGLPVVFGPTFELRPSRATAARLDVRGILRTAPEGARLSSDFGYGARAEFRFPGGGVAGRVYSDLAPFEDQPLSTAENGWSAFLLQRDYRDWYERTGGGGQAWVQPTASLRIELSLRRDHERSVRAVDPWSLFRNSDRWRRNPLSDDGHYFTTGLQVELDTRNDHEAPTTGWFLRGRFEHSTSDDIAHRAARDRPAGDPDGRRLCLRPAHPGPAPLLAPHPEPAHQLAYPGGWLGRRRPDADPTTGLAGRPRPAARLRVPGVHLRAAWILRSLLPCPVRPIPDRPGRGPHPPRSQPRVPAPRPGRRPRPVHRHRRGGPGVLFGRRQGVARRERAGAGPGEPHSVVPRMEGGRGGRGRRGADRCILGQGAERR